MNESKLFFNKLKSLSFYDKHKELQEKYPRILEQLKKNGLMGNKFYLRYELQLKRRVKDFFKTNLLRLDNIYNKDIFNYMKHLWYDAFKNIKKIEGPFNYSFSGSFKPNDIKNALAGVGLEFIGNNEIRRLLDRKHQSGKIPGSTVSRINKMIAGLENKFSTKSYYLQELEEKIKNVAKYHQ